jgi:hypothetical protein
MTRHDHFIYFYFGLWLWEVVRKPRVCADDVNLFHEICAINKNTEALLDVGKKAIIELDAEEIKCKSSLFTRMNNGVIMLYRGR